MYSVLEKNHTQVKHHTQVTTHKLDKQGIVHKYLHVN